MLLGLEILADGATVRVVMEAARRKSPAQCCLVASLPLDGIFLDLHGAMVAEHVDDGEGSCFPVFAGRSVTMFPFPYASICTET